MMPNTNGSVDERTVLDNLPGTASGVEAAGVRYDWQPYAFSWRWGVEGDFGHQGWHGLKAEMYDDFIRLGATERAFNGMVRCSPWGSMSAGNGGSLRRRSP